MSTDQYMEDIPFLEKCFQELGWIKSNSYLLIAGIAGINFIEDLVENFPKLDIIAADKEPKRIQSARFYNTSENVTYCLADIEKRDTLKHFFGTAQKILSYHNLESTTDVKVAFKNFYNLLAPEGTLAVRFIPHNPIFTWIKEISFRWRQFTGNLKLEPPLTKNEVVADISFQNTLKSMGFEILYFRTLNECRNFTSEAHCKKFLLSCCLSLFHKLPDRMKKGLLDDMFHRFAKYSTRNKKGDIGLHYQVVEMFLKKPK